MGAGNMSEREAWQEGWDAHFAEVQIQKHDPTHPITCDNPYGKPRDIIAEIRALLDEIEADPHHYGHTAKESWIGCAACTKN